jgi:colanic acid/amylovoran biosynthesis glycosyltransferase
MTTAPRIAYLVEEFPRPTEAFILRELQALESQGVEVYVYAVRKSERFTLPPHALSRAVTYVPSPARLAARVGFITGIASRQRKLRELLAGIRHEPKRAQLALLKELPRADYLARELKRRSITHLHAHFATLPASIAMLASCVYDVRFSFSAHAWDIFVYGDFLREKIRRARFVVACTQEGKHRLAALEPAGNIAMIRHGLDLTKFRFSPLRLAAETPRTLQVLSVARLVEKKGLPYLIEACALLRQSNERFLCRIIGEGEGERSLRQLIRAQNLERHVQILPFCREEELERHYRSAHVLVLPSIVCPDGDRDGVPNVLVEAMSLGVPVISTRTPAIEELIADRESGVLVEQRDASALTDAIRFVARNPEQVARMVERARRVVEEHFDIRKTSAELLNLFCQPG